MPKSTDKKTMPEMPGSNPSVNPKTGAVNPSAPTVGTEGWGNTSDERRVLQQNEPAEKRAGQKKSNPGDSMTAASEHESERAGAHKRPSQRESSQHDLSRRTSASSHSMNVDQSSASHSFRCADMGHANCRWEASGDSEEEVMRQVEEHGRKDHGMSDWSEAMRRKVRDNIHRREAA